MLHKIIAFLCVAGLILSFTASATPTSATFDDGYLPDGWTVTQPVNETDISGTKVYADEKMLHVEKINDTEEKTGAVRKFEKIYGPGNIWFVFSFGGEGKSYIELKESADSEIPAIKFAVSPEAIAYIDDTGEEIPLKSELNQNERYTVKISGTFSQKTTQVSVDGGSAATVAFSSESGAKNLTAFEIYTANVGNSVSLYHFSTDSTGSKYCWDEFQEEDDIEQWTFVASGNDIAEIRSTGGAGYLSLYVAKAGQKWEENGNNINADVRATLATTSGDFKVTIKYAAVGDGYSTLRLCRNAGGYWHSNYVLTGTTFGYNKDTSSTTTAASGMKSMEMHTITIYADRTAKLYDLYLDGNLIGENMDQVSAGADVYLGWAMFQKNNEKVGGIRIYSFEIEDEYKRNLSISGGKFTDENETEINAVQAGKVIGSYMVANNAKGDPWANLVMMYYEGNMLKSISVNPVFMKVGTVTEASGEIEVETAENSKVYMFLWNNMREIVPLTESASVLE